MSVDFGPMLRALGRRKSASALLVLEVAVGMVVLVSNVVTGANYWSLTFAPSGIDEDDLVLVTRRLPVDSTSVDGARAQATADLKRIARTSEVTAVAAVDELPLQDRMNLPTVIPAAGPRTHAAVAWPLRASGGVADALGLRLVRGRGFAPGERDVALVTSTLANHIAPGGDVIGLRVDPQGLSPVRIVGVVRDFRVAVSMAPDAQSVLVAADLPVSTRRLNYVVRVPPQHLPAVIASLDQTLGAGQVVVQHPDTSRGRVHRISRGALIVMGWMTIVVVGVALAGTLAVTSFSVSERTRQIGVRRALGATRGDITLYFLGENALMTTAGIIIGLAVVLPLNALLARLNLMPAATWWQVALSMALFWVAGLLSALAPARRAAQIPPTAATRNI